MSFGKVIVLIFAMIFSVGAIAIISEHFQKMAKIKADAVKKGSEEIAEAVDALRQEVVALRDTTTKFDVSFDTALQRLEQRVLHLESRAATIEPSSEAPQIIAGR